MKQLPPCIHRGNTFDDGTVECSTDRLTGHNYGLPVIRPQSVCIHPCPYTQRENRGVSQQTAIQLAATRKAANFARAVPRIVGGKRTKKPEREAREAVCNACEFKSGSSCGLCGCSVKWKLKYRGESCPVLKWEGDKERFKWKPKPATIACGITTCPREQQTIRESLDSIRQAGFQRISVVEDKNRDGAWNCFRRCLAQTVASNPEADAFVLFQDDVLVARNTRDYLLSVLWPDGETTGVVSLYCSGMYRFTEPGFHQRNGRTWGALALCFTPYAARLLLADTTPARKGEAVVDGKVSRWCVDAGLGYYVHWPSLIQHTGATSTVSKEPLGTTRRARVFVDDALNVQADRHP